MRLSDDSAGRRSRGGKSKAKKRCVSFNQMELQRNKTKGMSSELGRDTRTHIRRMSVDVGLFLGQKGLQVKSGGRGSSELSPTRGTPLTKEIESSIASGSSNNSNNNMAVAADGEREKGKSRVEEKANVKHGAKKKKGSKKLRRSFRLGSTEDDEDSVGEGPSQVQQLQQPSWHFSQIPPPKGRLGKFRSSLKKTCPEESAGMADSGSMVSVVEYKDKAVSSGGGGGGGAGKTEKKSKFGGSFPVRRWSWKLRKTDSETEVPAIPRDNDLPQCSIEEGGITFEIPIDENSFTPSPTSLAQTGDSWIGHAPNRAFATSLAPNKTPNKSFIGNYTHKQTFTK